MASPPAPAESSLTIISDSTIKVSEFVVEPEEKKAIRVRFIHDSDCVVTLSPAKRFALDGGSSTPVNAPPNSDTDVVLDEKLGNQKGCDPSNGTATKTGVPTTAKTAASMSESAMGEGKENEAPSLQKSVVAGPSPRPSTPTRSTSMPSTPTPSPQSQRSVTPVASPRALRTLDRSPSPSPSEGPGAASPPPISHYAQLGRRVSRSNWAILGLQSQEAFMNSKAVNWQELSCSKDSEEDLAEDGEAQHGELEED
ncbi:hypothetical protein OF83DRAFT_1088400 [Amylostereum chailletii]|nr:hypothetical protein OF83DRAFT_1088400 [Amylostereum chailletii]